MTRRLPCLIILALFATPASGLQLSTGAVIETPAVEGMSCGELNRKLSEIDGTGYRGTSPTPRDPADMPLFRYEDAVARSFYQNCVLRKMGRNEPPATLIREPRRRN